MRIQLLKHHWIAIGPVKTMDIVNRTVCVRELKLHTLWWIGWCWWWQQRWRRLMQTTRDVHNALHYNKWAKYSGNTVNHKYIVPIRSMFSAWNALINSFISFLVYFFFPLAIGCHCFCLCVQMHICETERAGASVFRSKKSYGACTSSPAHCTQRKIYVVYWVSLLTERQQNGSSWQGMIVKRMCAYIRLQVCVCVWFVAEEREINKNRSSRKNIGEIPSEWEKKARTEWKQVYWIQFGQWRCEWERSLYVNDGEMFFFFFKFSLLNLTQINGDKRKAYDISYANLKWLESVKCFFFRFEERL